MSIHRIILRLAHCNRCDCRFEWLPMKENSTKGEDTYPRCPSCNSYRETVDDGVKVYIKESKSEQERP